MSLPAKLLVLPALLGAFALASCTLDKAGAATGREGGGEGGASAASTGPGAAGGTASSSTASGDGGGVTTASSGQGAGGPGGGPSQGGGGSGGDGGAGGEGGSGNELEWLVRVKGPDVQTVFDLAIDPSGDFVYVVGVLKGDDATLDGLGLDFDAEGEDAFAAKLTADGTDVEWLVGFGGGGDDRATALAVTADGRVFVAGTAHGRDAGNGDVFAPGLETAPSDPFAWLLELDPESGEAVRGIPWGPIDLADPVDLAATSARVIATATCNGCPGGDGRDLSFALLDLADDSMVAGPVNRPLLQRAGAIGPLPEGDGFVLVGQFETSVNAASGDEPGCALTAVGQSDVFVASYTFEDGPDDYVCGWAERLGSTGEDRADDVFVDAAGDAYVASRFHAVPDFAAALGPSLVKIDAVEGVAWQVPLDPGVAGSEALAVAGDATSVVVGGRKTGDDGYLVRVAQADGAASPERLLIGEASVRALAVGGGRWLAGGAYAGTTSFGGDVGDRTSNGEDGFVMTFDVP